MNNKIEEIKEGIRTQMNHIDAYAYIKHIKCGISINTLNQNLRLYLENRLAVGDSVEMNPRQNSSAPIPPNTHMSRVN